MLTGNTDELKNLETLEKLMHHKNFTENNMIIKSETSKDGQGEERLKNIIAGHEKIMIRIEHPEIFLLSDIPQIRKRHAEQLTNILLELRRNPGIEREAIRKNLGALRTVFMELLDDINDIKKTQFYFVDPNRPLTERQKVSALNGKLAKDNGTIFLEPYCNFIYTIASDTSAHPFKNDNFPTIHTLNSAICAMKDVFNWIALNANK